MRASFRFSVIIPGNDRAVLNGKPFQRNDFASQGENSGRVGSPGRAEGWKVLKRAVSVIGRQKSKNNLGCNYISQLSARNEESLRGDDPSLDLTAATGSAKRDTLLTRMDLGSGCTLILMKCY